ncbi:TerC family protein [Agrilactobacillus fermenti]|uniref:TerC family protein n=1 Tax=Agrilactobacillus fermenti TaxID=2586909 RepID=UPI001E4249F8|nr:TerC family protein [Agrilactobacillus fermenti]MCD2257169.1 TerC family protein [Agrilactobacillus fermenti]
MQAIINLYQPFFDGHNWETVITSGQDWLVILSLVLMECLLSVDNAIVLAAQTQILPTKKQQEKSLFYGLWGAYIFRFLVIGIGVYLINFWFIKVFGSLYLLYLSVRYFYDRHNPDHAKQGTTKKVDNSKQHVLSLFWRVVISIEAMDIVFSIDSVLASLAISSNPVIVLIGGMIGILAMRGIAEIIMRLMQIIPELEMMAYGLIAFIAVKLFLSIPAIDIEIPNLVFALIVFGSLGLTILYHFTKKKKIRKF